ncbi:Glycosyltransferase involved in cell wall bisynthesis [Actinomadura meyerae]|uniref:Glycosyltransferase involved in cell wall bisynthesis n=1 Tax=Actinomadura meyerae TaxID=240840 RepID=A0A239NPY2_9ACTN|nr:Glycosyltransferase involved in cell wall bisynthesis [Actinomadura meyerae]
MNVSGEAMEDRPKVSVVVPVYNCRASLERTFTSVFEQSLPAADIEIIAVDDGSTDGGLDELRRMAGQRPRFTVLHQENSGGPGAPRNRGIEEAAGEYVFFLDADDYLGPEALERMCALADDNGTDVVVGQCVGIGRRPPVFPRDVPRTTLAESPFVYDTLSPLKLFRRSFLIEHGLRFVEGLSSHEDQPFTSRAYFEAAGISVLASYDCYYWVDREDGTSSLQSGGAPAEQYFPVIADVMSMVASRVEAGPLRDRLMFRHFRFEVFNRFGARYLAASEEEKAFTRLWGRKLVDSWYTDGVAAEFGPRTRLIAHCLRADLDDVLEEVVPTWIDGVRPATVVDGDRAYMAFPRFRDPSAGIPDSCYDITERIGVRSELTGVAWERDRLRVDGVAGIAGVETAEHRVSLLLRDPDGTVHRVPAARRGGGEEGAFRAHVEFGPGSPVGPGTWSAEVEVRVHDLVKVKRLTAAGDMEPPGTRLTRGALAVQPRLGAGRRGLELAVTEAGLGRLGAVDEVAWDERARLRVRVQVPSALPAGHPVQAAAELVPRDGGAARAGTADCQVRYGALVLTAEFDLADCPPGRFDPRLEITLDGRTVRGRPPCPDGDLPAAAWFRREAMPYRTKRGALAVRVAQTGVVSRSRRMVRRFRAR